MVSLLGSGRGPRVYADWLLGYCLESNGPLAVISAISLHRRLRRRGRGRPPAGDAPAAAGGGLDYVKQVLTDRHRTFLGPWST